MNMTLQPYAPTNLYKLSHYPWIIHKEGGFHNYTGQIKGLSNSIIHMVKEGEKRFGSNTSENNINKKMNRVIEKQKSKRHITSQNAQGFELNPHEAGKGCLNPQEHRASLPVSTIDVDIEYLDPSTVTRLNVNDKNQDGLTSLMRVALTGGTSDDIKTLLRKGANVDLQDNADNTALMWVVKSLFRLENETRIQIKLKIVDVLINNNANLNLADKEGFTPLMIAAMGSDENSFRKLFNKNAMVELRNNDGQTALHLAVKYSASKNIIDQLSMFYQKMNVNDENGHTPFMIASFYGKLNLMDSFFNKGANIDHVDAKGWTALMHAVNCKKEDVVNKLCQYGAKVNFMTSHHISAIAIAFGNNDKKIALALIKAGAVTKREGIKHWLREVLHEHGLRHNSTEGVAGVDKAFHDESNAINISASYDETVVISPILETDLNGDKTAESNSSKSGESSYSISHWILNKMRGLYEMFKHIASPIPPL